MKIFNWVHRKFQRTALKGDEFARDMKKEVESQTLLHQISLEMGLLDSAILTIGTLGFDHPYEQTKETEEEPKEDFSSSNAAATDDDDDESEVNPLVFTAVKHDEFDFSVMRSPEKKKLIMSVDGDSLMPEIVTADDQKMMTGPRTTLADLFLADSNHVKTSNLNSSITFARNKPKQADSGTKRQATAAAKNNHSVFSSKKLIPQVGHKPHPVKKLNRMMKRIMKGKIHPELYQGNCKNMDETELEAFEETTYLLPIPAY